MDFINLLFSKIQVFLSDPETLKIFVNNRFLMIFFVAFIVRLKYKTYSNIYIAYLVNIPGTFLHEAAHFFVGFLFNAYPTSFDLIPKRQDDYYVMGSVGFRNIRFYNAIPASLAPLLLLVVGFYFNRWFFLNVQIGYINYLLYILLQSIIIENAIPSMVDFKVAFSYPLGIIFYSALFVLSVIFIF